MSSGNETTKANAEARLKRAEAKAIEGVAAKDAHVAAVVARDANTARLKGLRLARDESDLVAAVTNHPPTKGKVRVRKPKVGA